MGSRFTICLGIAPKVRLENNYHQVHDRKINSEQPPAVSLILDKSEKENPIQNELDWNEV
jgi:hypothetical protein